MSKNKKNSGNAHNVFSYSLKNESFFIGIDGFMIHPWKLSIPLQILYSEKESLMFFRLRKKVVILRTAH